MNTLIEALIEAIKVANTNDGDPSHTAVALHIYEDSSFEIGQRCWPNTIFAQFALENWERDRYTLTVSSTDYPAKQWPFGLLEFCSRHQIKISNRNVADQSGKVRGADWANTSDNLKPAIC